MKHLYTTISGKMACTLSAEDISAKGEYQPEFHFKLPEFNLIW